MTALPDPTKNRRLQVSALPRKEWSADEDALIKRGVEQLGCRWRVIAAQLPGRSDDAVRNRWSRLQESLRGTTHGRRASSEAPSASSGDTKPAGDDEHQEGRSSSSSSSSSDGGGASIRDRGGGGLQGAGRCANTPAVAKPLEVARLHHNVEASRGSSGGLANGGRSARAGVGSGDEGATATVGSHTPSCGSADGSNGGGRGGLRYAAAAGSSGKVSKSGGRASNRSREGSGGGADGGSAEKKERTSWTRAEDDVIIRGVAELGHKWYEIARRLPGRTDHAIRNRWSRLQSIMGMQSMAENVVKQPSSLLTNAPAIALGMSDSTMAAACTVGSGPTRGAGCPTLPCAGTSASTTAGAGGLTSAVASADVPPVLDAASCSQMRLPHSQLALAPPVVQQTSSTSTSNLGPPPPLSADAAPPSEPTLASLSMATLASHHGDGTDAGYRPIPSHDGASGGSHSEGSDAELTTGTAELLLLHSGGAPSCQPSPLIMSTRPVEECPEMGAAPPPKGSGLPDVPALSKRPRV